MILILKQRKCKIWKILEKFSFYQNCSVFRIDRLVLWNSCHNYEDYETMKQWTKWISTEIMKTIKDPSRESVSVTTYIRGIASRCAVSRIGKDLPVCTRQNDEALVCLALTKRAWYFHGLSKIGRILKTSLLNGHCRQSSDWSRWTYAWLSSTYMHVHMGDKRERERERVPCRIMLCIEIKGEFHHDCVQTQSCYVYYNSTLYLSWRRLCL